MKKVTFILAVLSASIAIAQTPCSGGTIVIPGGGPNNDYPCSGLTLQSYIPSSDFDAYECQDSWGWTDSDFDGHEYAIVALNNGTAFVDITDPINPVYLGRMDSHSGGSNLWRDVKVYSNHAFVVSEVSADGLQIFDLTRLRGLTPSGTGSSSRILLEDAHLFIGDGGSNDGRAHNIVINEESGFAYIVGVNRSSNSNGGPIFVNIQNPTNPIIVGEYGGSDYFHDAQVLTYDGPDPDYIGKEIMIGANENEIVIVDVTNKANPVNINTVNYPNVNYTHQGWFTEDRRFFILGDEVDEENHGFNTRTLVFDFEDLDSPSLFYTYYGSTPAIDHNGYVKGNRFYLANYAAGVRVLKVNGLYDSTPSMTEVAFMDTYPSSNTASFHGTWNVYPFFESGNIFTTGFGNDNSGGDGGLFIMRDPNYDNTPPTIICQSPTIYLDPNTGTATIDETDLDNGSTDDFGIVDWTLTGQTTFTCADVGGTFNITLEGEDDYGNKASCVSTVTIAAAPTTYSGGSWSDGVPGPGSNAIIDGTYTTVSNTSIDACTCTINNSASLTINAGDYLKTNGDINVAGSLIVAHQGSVVQVDPNATVNKIGGAMINVNLTTPDLASRDFMVMGSPMTAETRDDVWVDPFLVLYHDTSLFVPNPEVEAQMPGAENFADDNYNNWIIIDEGFNTPINPGEGYIVRPQAGYGQPGGTYNYTYKEGTLNNGDITFDVIYNGNKNSSPNVVANPYPSAISALAFIAENSMVDELFFWEHNTPPSATLPGAGSMNFSMQDISMYNNSGGIAAVSGGNSPNEYISTGQGFAFKATAAGTALFNNDMRRTDNNNTFRRPDGKDRIWLKIANAEYQMQSTTLVAFSEEATIDFDPGYDSRRLATVVSFFSGMENQPHELGIQTRGTYESGVKIPLGYSTLIDEKLEYKISIENIEGVNLSNANVFLRDNFTNTIVLLEQMDSSYYAFESEPGTFYNRFTLIFQSEVTLGPDENELDSVMVFPNPTSNSLTVYSPNANLRNIEVYDILGKRLAENIQGEHHGYTIELSSLETGVYFVKIDTESGSVTKKVIKK